MATAPLPRELREWRNRHDGATMVVCGCGRSLRDLPEPTRWLTIGVNDVGRLFDPTYLVVLNPKSQFAADRFRYVAESRARALFTQVDPCQFSVECSRIVRFHLGRRGGTDLSAADSLPYTRNSPYVAVCLAAFMGARRIGLIGVDFTDHHFFGATGRHALTRELAAVDREYAGLAAALARSDVELVNLSHVSRLTALPKADPASFLDGSSTSRVEERRTISKDRPLTIVSYATTPVAGVPPILARCISARTKHRARCVWANRGYSNGVTFDGDIEWTRAPRDAAAVLAEADVVIVHNGRVDARHASLLAHKPVVTMAHNYMWNVGTRFVAKGFPGVVVGQYQATLPEFASWSVVANPLPLWEDAFAPGVKPASPTICYTPSGRHERYPTGHRLYWHAKGYDTTMRVLDRLAARYDVQLEVIRNGQLPHAEVLAMKRRSHIVIDECVTGSYHRNSLEGLAAGCVVVNGVGLVPAVADVFRRCAPHTEHLPWTFSALEDLEETLTRLILSGPDALQAQGEANRAWIEQHWNFSSQWEQFWWPVVSAALARQRRQAGSTVPVSPRRPPAMRPARQRVSVPRHTISVVVPHGGPDRLAHLATTLASLRQRDAVAEVVVSEMGGAPLAREVSARWADKYVFTPNAGAFERARALNVGSGVAESELVLWHDNDLLTGPEFVARAARELHDRRLNYLIPYTSVRYLSEAESLEVMQGGRAPSECRPVSVLYSGRRTPACSGGAGLVKRDFLLRYGGLIEGFRGWGGEDNAWNRKVALLGRSAPTQRSDQHAYHLFHACSAGYPGQTTGARNPHYAHNLALLQRISSIHDARRFLQEFPPPPHRSCPWDPARRIVLLAGEGSDREKARAIAQALREAYGAAVDDTVVSQNNGWLERAALADAVVVIGAAATDECAVDLDAEVGRPVVTLRLASLPPDPAAAAIALVGPLSVVLGGAMPAEARPMAVATPPAPVTVGESDTIPIWTYWEGSCPAWIQQCRATIDAHAPGVRHLTPDAFDRLRDRDRDIDLSGLGPAHRADFIRAFLLARYSGLWIDADCLVMQSLRPVVEQLRAHDFVAHRERSGYVSNGFIGARPDSVIAGAFYDRLCQILRSKQRLGWISLGGEPLTEVLNGSTVPWYELPCERIQPICWSNPHAFFTRGSQSLHESGFDPRAFCYMMSNAQISRSMGTVDDRLTGADTFFTFLVNKSLGDGSDADDEQIFAGFVEAYRRFGDESLSGPGSSLAQTVELRERLPVLLEQLGIGSLLDAPCGDFNWMRSVRLAVDAYVGVDLLEEIVAENQRRHGTPSRSFRRLDLRTDPLPAMDAVLCRDGLVHLSFTDALAAVRNFRRSGARYLLTTTFPGRQENRDTSRCQWRPLNLELPPFGFPTPLRAITERCSEAGGAYQDKTLAVWALSALPI